MAYIDADYIDGDYIDTEDAEVPVYMIPFVAIGGRLGATLMGAPGALDIPYLSIVLAVLIIHAQGWVYG
jgi:hypothetical protein